MKIKLFLYTSLTFTQADTLKIRLVRDIFKYESNEGR